MSEEINDDRGDEAVSDLSPLEEARKRINLALIDIKEIDCPLQRFPCTLFSGCGFEGYVFNPGLSPTKRSSIVSSITDLMSDYRTTPAVVRKQIEHSLVKSGDTGFGSG